MFTVIQGDGQKPPPIDEQIAVQLATRFARELIRSIIVLDPELPVSRACDALRGLLDHLAVHPINITVDELVRRAVLRLSDFGEPDHPLERAIHEIARRGAGYLVELTAEDQTSASRLSTRHGQLHMAIRRFEDLEANIRKERRAAERAAAGPAKRKRRKPRKVKRQSVEINAERKS